MGQPGGAPEGHVLWAGHWGCTLLKASGFFKGQWSHWFVNILCEVHNTAFVSLVRFPVSCPTIQLLVQSPPDQGLARPVQQIQSASEKKQLLRDNSLFLGLQAGATGPAELRCPAELQCQATDLLGYFF